MKKLLFSIMLVGLLLVHAAPAQSQILYGDPYTYTDLGRYDVWQCTNSSNFFSGYSTGQNSDGGNGDNVEDKSYRTLEKAYSMGLGARLGNFKLVGGYEPRVSNGTPQMPIQKVSCSNTNRMGVQRFRSAAENDVYLAKSENNATVKLRKMLQVARKGDWLRQGIRVPVGTSILDVGGNWSACRTVEWANKNALPQIWLTGPGFGGRLLPFRADSNNKAAWLFPANEPEAEKNYFTTPSNPSINNNGTTPFGCDDNQASEKFGWYVRDPCARYFGKLPADRYRRCIADKGGGQNAGRAFVDRNGGSIPSQPQSAIARDGTSLRFGLFCRWDPSIQQADKGKECFDPEYRTNGTWFRSKKGQNAEVSRIKMKVIDTSKPELSIRQLPGQTLSYPGGASWQTVGEETSKNFLFTASDQGGGLFETMISSDKEDTDPQTPPRNIYPPITSPPTHSFAPVGWRAAVAPGTWLPTDGISYQYRWEFCNNAKASCRTLNWKGNHMSDQAWLEINPNKSTWLQANTSGWLRPFVRATNKAGSSPEIPGGWVRVLPFGSQNPAHINCQFEWCAFPHGSTGEVVYGSLPGSVSSAATSYPPNGSDLSIKEHIIGSPREGQTITYAGGWNHPTEWTMPKLRNINRCPHRMNVLNECGSPIHDFGPNGQNSEYKLTAADVGKWIGYSTDSWAIEEGGPVALFPAAQPIPNVQQFGRDFGSPLPELLGTGGTPSARDWGILPAHAFAEKELCPDPDTFNIADPVWDTSPSLWRSDVPKPYRTVAAVTNPCSTAATTRWWDTESGGQETENIWREGLNENIRFSVRDFCNESFQRNCFSNFRQQSLARPILFDSAAPSVTDPESPYQKFQDNTEVRNGVRCRVPSGENGWHITDPACRIQVVDKHLVCEGYFRWDQTGCSASREPTSLVSQISWSGSGLLRGNSTSLPSSFTQSDFFTPALRDGRPEIEVEASDRALNATEKTSYSDFVKIDIQDPEALQIIDGPGETPPSGYLDSDEENPRPPDETNDTKRQTEVNPDAFELETDRDCPLCWTVQGLEEAEGEPPTPEQVAAGEIPFDYDHPSRLQCQLVYAGSGRTASGTFADWKAPPWSVDQLWKSGQSDDLSVGDTVSALGGATIYKDTDKDEKPGSWDCLQGDPFGDKTEGTETVAPFDLEGLPDGHYMFRVRQQDRAGRTSAWTGRPFILDTTAPETEALSRAALYDIQDTQTSTPEELQSTTKQWQINWGWDLLQTGQSAAPPSDATLAERLDRPRVQAGVYCFIRNVATGEIVRRSGWGCNESTFAGPTRGLETPMPWPGVGGEGAGTLAGLPDGNYEIGFLQRDRLGHTTRWEDAPTIPLIRDREGIGIAPSPSVELQTKLDPQSVTSRRTPAELALQVSGDHLLPGQAFFPMNGWISHYTPQELYSYCQVMTDNYSEYTGEGWEREIREVGVDAPDVSCPYEDSAYSSGDADSYSAPTEVRWSGGVSLDEFFSTGEPGSVVDVKRGTFILDIFWMQPTDSADPESTILGDIDD